MREYHVLSELSLDDDVRVGTLMAELMAMSAPTIVHPPSDLVRQIRVHTETTALNIAQQLACDLRPWDEGWKENFASTTRQLNDLGIRLGLRGPVSTSLVARIEEFERLKRAYEEERAAEQQQQKAEETKKIDKDRQ